MAPAMTGGAQAAAPSAAQPQLTLCGQLIRPACEEE
jgi:hypothetical protein